MSRNYNTIFDRFYKSKGGKLVFREAIILGLCAAGYFGLQESYAAAVIAFIVLTLGIPVLVGLFQGAGWVMALVFSLMWAFVVGFLAGGILWAIFGTYLPGLLIGIIVFLVSFHYHRVYSDLRIHDISIRKNNRESYQQTDEPSAVSDVSFCPICGRMIKSPDGKCEYCDK